MDVLRLDAPFESSVAAGLRHHIGRSVSSIGAEVGVRPSPAKQYVAMVMRELAVQSAPGGSMAAFDSRGIEVKTVRSPIGGRPFEGMSFPAFRSAELIEESWESSRFRKHLRRLLMIRVVAPARETPHGNSTFSEFQFWSPTNEDVLGIRNEWEDFRSRIASGATLRLPTESQTSFIHVRPKARDKDDLESAPGARTVVRKCFWLNRGFVASILGQSD